MVKGAKVYTFSQLAEKINESRGKTAKLASNTVGHFISSQKIGVKLHQTDVVVINSDGTYQLYTGGYQTPTTSDRLNGFSPATVKSIKGTLCVVVGKDITPFVEGIKVDRAGVVIGGVKTSSVKTRSVRRS